MLILLLVIIAVTCLWFAVFIAGRVQKWVDRQNRKGRHGQAVIEKRIVWLSHFHGIWYGLVAAVAALDYIYEAWAKAPNGSFAKFGWYILIAMLISVALMAIVKLVDKKLNGNHSFVNASITDTNDKTIDRV